MKKIGFVFSGYGSQWVGMGKELYDQSREAQELFEEASSCLDLNFVKLCFASSDIELSKLEHAYVALFVVSIALAKALEEAGIKPDLVAGANCGEYAAVSVARGLNVPDALYLLRKYAGFYQAYLDQTPAQGLTVTGIGTVALEKLCRKISKKGEMATVAVVVGPEEHIVMATEVAYDQLREVLNENLAVRLAPASVGGGFHAPVMDDIVKNLKNYLQKVDFKDCQVPFVSGVIGEPLMVADMVRASLMQAIHAQSQWQMVKDAFVNCDYIIEVGPGKQLQESLAADYPDKKVYAVNSLADVERLKEELLPLITPAVKDEQQSDQNESLQSDTLVSATVQKEEDATSQE